jgi:hypothetical protein
MSNPWEKIVPPAKDVNALRVDASHPLDLFWAKDHLGRYLFIYEYPSDSNIIIKDPPDLVGVETISIPVNSEISRIVFILKEKANWELFLALCQDLLNATKLIKTPGTGSTIILHRLRRWQEFLKKKRLDIMSEEKIKGLIGELLFLRKYLIPRFGCTDAVKFWLGPEGAPQDFSINENAVEVKCQLGGTRANVKISSADQLTTQLPKLYLFVVTLGKTTKDNNSAVNLPSLISEILYYLEQESSQSLNRFQDLLLEAGYAYSQKYYEYNYLLLEEHVYLVTDGFPRICPNDLVDGILSLSYNIGLTECIPFEIDISNWELLNE